MHVAFLNGGLEDKDLLWVSIEYFIEYQSNQKSIF